MCSAGGYEQEVCTHVYVYKTPNTAVHTHEKDTISGGAGVDNIFFAANCKNNHALCGYHSCKLIAIFPNHSCYGLKNEVPRNLTNNPLMLTTKCENKTINSLFTTLSFCIENEVLKHCQE